MQLVFIFVMTISAAYFGLVKRRFDFFSAAFVGCVLYFMPGFFGVSSYISMGRWVDSDIVPETYLVMLFVTLAVTLGAFLYDQMRRPSENAGGCSSDLSTRDYRVLLIAIGGLAVGALASMLVLSGGSVFAPDKSEMLEGLGRSHLVFRHAAQLGFILAVLRGHRWAGSLFFVLLLFDVYIGFRSGLAMALGALLVVWLSKKGPVRLLVNQKKVVLLSLLAVTAVIFYKGIGGHVKAGNWEYIVQQKLHPEEILRPFREVESFAVVNNLNQIIVSGYKDSLYSVLDQSIAGAIPLAGLLGFGRETFDFQVALFSEVDYGLAYSIWGQMWSAGGWPLLIVFTGLFLAVIAYGNRFLYHPKLYVVATVANAMVIWCIYIHRNNIGFQLNVERRVLMLLVFLWLLTQILRLARRKSTAHVVNHLPTAKHDSARP